MIYLVEDDDSIRELVIYTLRSTGMEAKGFGLPSAFWRAMAEETPELVLLDIMLPEEDGLEILKKLRSRQATKTLPVIMLTAKGTEYDQVVGLDNGADDYIPKPISLPIMIKKIEAVLRRYEGVDITKDHELKYREIILIVGNYQVKIGKKLIDLTQKEYEILKELIENQGCVITRESFLNRLWKYEFEGEERAVDNHIKNLRRKLGKAGDYIKTVRGVGYRIDKAN